MLSVPLGGWWRLALIAAVAFALVVGLTFFMVRIFYPLALFLVAVVIAEALSPVIAWLQRRGLSRGASILVVYIALLVVTAFAAWMVFPPVINQITQGVGQLPTQVANAENYVTRQTGISNSQLENAASTVAARIAERYGTMPIRVISALFDVILIYFLSIYWLFAAPPLKKFVLSLFPIEKRQSVDSVLGEIGREMGGYLRGSVISGFITGTLAYFGLLIVGVQFALALGVLTFFGELIPVIGVIIAGTIVVTVALFQGFTFALLALAVYVVILFLESHLIAPNIMRTQTDVSQVVVLFAVVAGYEVGGILGALVAIPLSAGIRVLVIQVFAPGVRQWTGAEPHPDSETDDRRSRMSSRGGLENAFRVQNAAAFITEAIHRRGDPEKPERRRKTG